MTNTSGTVSPGGAPGTLTVDGTYSQAAGGTLAIAIDSTGDYSTLAVSGDLTGLAGTLAMEPTAGYAGSAAQGDEFDVISGYANGPSFSGEFTTITTTEALQAAEQWVNFGPIDAGDYVVEVGEPAAPVETALPVISGTTQPGDVLSTTNGTWNNGPTVFSYQWKDCTTGAAASCTNVTGSGGTSSHYTLTSADLGSYITVVVTAGHGGEEPTASATAVAVGPVATPPAPPVTPAVSPAPTTAPSISGTPLPGDTLTCNPGTWTGNPSFTYQWNLGTSPISGATTHTYTVTVLDEGSAITCTVDATGAGGTKTATTGGAIVAQAGTLKCPAPTGAVTTSTVGPVKIGETRKAARAQLPTKFYAPTAELDNFCLYGGWGIRVGYISNKIVLALTANPYYALDGLRTGDPASEVAHKFKVGKIMNIGANGWYVVPGHGTTNYIIKIDKGLVGGIGIAYKRYTTGRKSQEHFLAAFRVE